MDLSREDKVRFFRELIRGAPDVFAVRSLGSRVGHEPWQPVYAPLEDKNITAHLAGLMEIGTYPLVPDDEWPRTHWIAADFDGKEKPTSSWKGDVKRAVEFLSQFDGCPCFVNLSRSRQGAHVRMLFRESVPAWLARRWMTNWLTEAEIIRNEDDFVDEIPSSFDRFFPTQDSLDGRVTQHGYRSPGNLIGSPMQGSLVRRNGGTLPLDPALVMRGQFEPDGKHWEHVVQAVEQRAWGEKELTAALFDSPGDRSALPPIKRANYTTIPGTAGELDYVLKFCSFMRRMREPDANYHLWIAMASQLHRFGEEGRRAFHELSAMDSRYNARITDSKWDQTGDLRPVRCDSLVSMGFRCEHLDTDRCGGARCPSYFAEHTHAEIL